MKLDYHEDEITKSTHIERCDMCGCEIAPNENFVSAKGMFFDEPYKYIGHIICNDFRNKVILLGQFDDGVEVSFKNFSDEGKNFGFKVDPDLAAKFWSRLDKLRENNDRR